MNAFDAIGYLASLLVLDAFCMHDMRRLRLLAIASNFALIGYGARVATNSRCDWSGTAGASIELNQ